MFSWSDNMSISLERLEWVSCLFVEGMEKGVQKIFIIVDVFISDNSNVFIFTVTVSSKLVLRHSQPGLINPDQADKNHSNNHVTAFSPFDLRMGIRATSRR